MSTEKNYLAINKESWNNKVDYHLKSEFYDLEAFLQGKSSLNPIELNLLGDLKDKSILHLQCHFGQDSISLARLGAKVTAVDLSNKAIEAAKNLATKTQSNATFICCDVYDLPNHLNQQFDVVFTSYGVIGWLPNLNKWANIIQQFLKTNGKFIMVEFHPVLWMFSNDFKKIAYNYSNAGAIVETYTGTYADKNAKLKQEYVMWNHGLGEVLSSLLSNNLNITLFEEFDYSPYNCFNDAIEFEPKKYRVKSLGNKIPLVYSLVAQKN